MRWKTLSSNLLVDSPWLRVHENSYELPNGSVIPKYYITERSDSALCVCYTGQRFVLVRQYRPGIDQFTLCHPGGRLESGDPTPISGAVRELLEETGYRPSTVELLGTYAQIPAVSAAKVHLVLVHCDVTALITPNLDPTEDLHIELVTPTGLVDAINSGEMNCIACVAASYRALSHLGIVR